MKRFAAAIILAIAFTAAAAPTPLRAAQRAGRGIGTIFVSDLISNAVWVCSGNIRYGMLPPTAQLQGVASPVQMAVDRAGTLYVANAQVNGSGGSVTEYPRGSMYPSLTLTSGLNTSTGVAVDSSGTVYVSNKYAGSIEVFPSGQTQPAATVTANLVGPDGLTVDRRDNLYIVDGSRRDVLKLTHGSMTPRPLHLQQLSTPIGIAIDSHNNLYVSNLEASTSHVSEYLPNATTPSQTFVVPGQPLGSESTVGQPMMLSMADDTLLASTTFSIQVASGFESGPSVVAFTAGQSQPLWIGYGVWATDAVFLPK
jgi:hypothetical protein